MDLYLLLVYGAMAVWSLFSVMMMIQVSSDKGTDTVNEYIYESIPNVFTTLGVLGTFLGIYYGLEAFDTNNIDGSISELLEGLKTAFITSIVGIIAALIFGRFSEFAYGRAESKGPPKATSELMALQELNDSLKVGQQQQHDQLNALQTAPGRRGRRKSSGALGQDA